MIVGDDFLHGLPELDSGYAKRRFANGAPSLIEAVCTVFSASVDCFERLRWPVGHGLIDAYSKFAVISGGKVDAIVADLGKPRVVEDDALVHERFPLGG